MSRSIGREFLEHGPLFSIFENGGNRKSIWEECGLDACKQPAAG